MNEIVIEQPLYDTTLQIRLRRIGKDCLITVHGGTQPHIGCAALAVPRPSLTGDGSSSATSSVLNLIGHKDETLCRYLAESVAAHTQSVTVCTGGFHLDQIREEQIQTVIHTVKEMTKALIAEIRLPLTD